MTRGNREGWILGIAGLILVATAFLGAFWWRWTAFLIAAVGFGCLIEVGRAQDDTPPEDW